METAMKKALVYDWFSLNKGGGEKAFEEIYKLYPSPIYTLFHSHKSLVGTSYEKEKIVSSFLQKWPRIETAYRNYLPFFPLAIESLDLSSYDVIISASHCVAKGVLTHAEQKHLCYCYTPMRYAWDLYYAHMKDANLEKGIKARLAQFFLHYLRMWDVASLPRVDAFAAVSHYVAKRIAKTYGKKAEVIYPPVDTDFFFKEEKKDSYYLTASRLVPYKKIDLIVEAFSQRKDQKLVVIGDGPDMAKIKKKAASNIEILGYTSNEVLRDYMQKAKAFIFAATEDFGIIPIEAQSTGTCVIAYGKGALLETLIDQKTALFFHEETPKSLLEAVDRFEKSQDRFDPHVMSEHAKKFSIPRFQQQFQAWVEKCM